MLNVKWEQMYRFQLGKFIFKKRGRKLYSHILNCFYLEEPGEKVEYIRTGSSLNLFLEISIESR